MSRPRFLVPLALAAALVAVPALAGPGGGQDATVPLQEKVDALRRKAEDLRAAGKGDAAEECERMAQHLLEKMEAARAEDARRAEAKARLDDLRERAAAAKAAGRGDEAAALAEEAEALARHLQSGQGGGGGDLDRAAKDLREKARMLREKGSVEDAEHLEGKAARVEKAVALRREANELEQRMAQAKEAGRAEEARELAEASRRAWRQSEELLGKTAPVKVAASEARDLLRGSPDDARRRIDGLRRAADVLREAGLPDRAESLAHQAAEAERLLESRTADGAEEMERMTVELERLRRRLAELEEQIARRREELERR